MRRPDTFKNREGDLDSMMTPMIDVVFLLLVFFVWTTSIQVIEYVMHSDVTAQQGNLESNIDEPPPEQDFEDIVIKISWNGQLPSWTINEVPLGTVQLVSQQMQAIAQIKPDAPIIIDPESLVPVGYVIEVFDIAKLAGFEQISFAVEQEPMR